MIRGSSELAAGRARGGVAPVLEAPRKRMFSVEHGGHAVLTERPDALRAILTQTVLPETYAALSD